MKNTGRIEVNSRSDAWKIVDEIFPMDYEKDEISSKNAGYPVFRATGDGNYYNYICCLNDRMEVNFSGGKTVNIWYSEAYFRMRDLACHNVKLSNELDEMSGQLAWEKHLNKLYEEEIAKLRAENEELQNKLQKIFNITVNFAEVEK